VEKVAIDAVIVQLDLLIAAVRKLHHEESLRDD